MDMPFSADPARFVDRGPGPAEAEAPELITDEMDKTWMCALQMCDKVQVKT